MGFGGDSKPPGDKIEKKKYLPKKGIWKIILFSK